jgi:hypothetical protein
MQHLACSAGALLLTVSNGPDLQGLFLMFVITQTIYGIGVGGEYPVVSQRKPPLPLLACQQSGGFRVEDLGPLLACQQPGKLHTQASWFESCML